MIAIARNSQEWRVMASFLHYHAQVQPSADLKCIGWVSDDNLVAVAGLDGFMGKTAQIHIAYAPGWHFTPRLFSHVVFDYAFNKAKREMLLGLLNSNNKRAMRWDLHLGFREVFRLPGMYEDGGDIVLLAMKKSECRYLKPEPEVPAVAVAGSA